MTNSKIAAIFDMDGTMVDNSEYHQQAWRKFLQKYGKNLSEPEMREHIYGRTNQATLEFVFGRELSPQEILKYSEEKESIYRDIYRPHIRPVDGLVDFLQGLKRRQITAAIATSADPPNVDFVLDTLGLRDYFKVIVDSTEVIHGKPDPEIYLKTAEKIGRNPENCTVFEDSVSGIKAGKAAGMKVIAITTTHSTDELSDADGIIDSFSQQKVISQIMRVQQITSNQPTK